MNKIVKFAVLPLVGVVVIVAALAAYLAATFDPNQYKSQIARIVNDRTQRTLKLEGDIKLSLFPGIGITLGKVSLSERAADTEFAAVEAIRVTLKLMPLLSRRVVADAVEVKNLRANLVRYQNGKTNIDDLIGAYGEALAAASSVEPKIGIDIGRIRVENATIAYSDQGEGIHYALSGLNFTSGRIAYGLPSTMDLAFGAQSDEPRLNLEVTLKSTVTFDPGGQSVVFDGLDVDLKGLAAGVSDLTANARGKVEANLSSGEFLISRLAIAASGKQDGRDFNIHFEMPRLNLARDRVSGDQITLDATFNRRGSRLAARLDISGIAGNARAVTAGQLGARVDLRQDGATTKVRLSSPLAGDVEARQIELPKLSGEISVHSPALPKNPVVAPINGTARIDFARRRADLAFAARFDDSNVNGKAGLARFSPPFYTFDIAIDRLDADRYWPKPDPSRKPAAQPFDLSALTGLNASGRLSIGALKLANVQASNVRFDVSPLAAAPGVAVKQ